MIEMTLIFQEAGLLVFKKNYSANVFEIKENEELVSGFFSALFSYISSNFGEITEISTKNKKILINKTSGIYISIVYRLFKDDSDDFIKRKMRSDEIWMYNKRLEELCGLGLNQIGSLIAQTYNKYNLQEFLLYPSTKLYKEFSSEIDKIILSLNSRIENLERILKSKLKIIDELFSKKLSYKLNSNKKEYLNKNKNLKKSSNYKSKLPTGRTLNPPVLTKD
ncbi:MAG: hypothetical protein ACTSU2_01055 [Promethearchaeota archaeon]